MKRQIGFFLLIIGMIVLLVFVASYQVGTPEFAYCLVGFLILGWGAWMVFRNRATPEPADRFRFLRRRRERKKEE